MASPNDWSEDLKRTKQMHSGATGNCIYPKPPHGFFAMPTKNSMRIFGIVLLIAGIIMMAVSGFNFTTEKEVLDVGPLEVNKEENHRVGWPVWVGGVAALAGVVVLVAGRKKAG